MKNRDVFSVVHPHHPRDGADDGRSSPVASLSETIASHLMQCITDGVYGVGDKLPSNAELCEAFGVSRTVVREAIAALKLGGRVVSRQGAGVFIAHDGEGPTFAQKPPVEDIQACLEILELRIGIEVQAAALAAQRNTPETLFHLHQAHENFLKTRRASSSAEADADFQFHLAIARGAGNPRFVQFLESMVADINRDLHLKYCAISHDRKKYFRNTALEHESIINAISAQNTDRARQTMLEHLNDGLARYRILLKNHDR